ncbi:MAG: YitT family protein, partial [Lachnospiraceae bacterium]|nr:YitT family protein [Lachnospiraceae bacterium]
MLVITNKPKEVYDSINKKTHHTATKFEGTGCYQGEEKSLVYSVVTSNEVRKMVDEIHDTDPEAFVNVLKTEYIEGNFFSSKDY